jgi:hypothetical protein
MHFLQHSSQLLVVAAKSTGVSDLVIPSQAFFMLPSSRLSSQSLFDFSE